MGFSRQEYWSGLSFPPPGVLPNAEIKPESPHCRQILYYLSHQGSSNESRSAVPDSLRPHGLQSPWNSPDQNTTVGSCSLLQGIFPTQGSDPGLLHCRWLLHQLSHKGSPTEEHSMAPCQELLEVSSQHQQSIKPSADCS